MNAVTERDTHTVSIMAGTQLVKSEVLINVAGYFICQDPSAILFVQPTQTAAESFSKERFAPTVAATPALRALVEPPKARDTDNTITAKHFPGGSLNFVGANSPTDLASRPVRVVLADEIDKYPASAGSEGDPLKLAEERASTYKTVGRAKFVRTCSPTLGPAADGQPPISRIGREYEVSDQRKLYLACPHCEHEQVLTWAHVHWDRDDKGGHLPETAALTCEACGAIWTERERIDALDALERKPGYGWRQTREFFCCGDKRKPTEWDEHGRSVCPECGALAPYAGHAGFHLSKLYSKRHRLPEIVTEFLECKGDPELLQKWTNTALAELWRPYQGQGIDSGRLITRAEEYGPDDLPEEAIVITGFCDVQDDRLEVQLVAWGHDEECWPFKYEIIHLDPAQPEAWKELDALITSPFKTKTGRALRVAAFGIDTGGHQAAQVFSFCNARRGRRVFACKGAAGSRPIWPGRASKSKNKDPLYILGVDTAKDAIYARLRIDPPEPGKPKPGFIHFPIGENFGPDYFDQLNSERRQVRLRMGQPYTMWVKVRERNEALDTMVGALAMRKALPRNIARTLEYSLKPTKDEAPAPVMQRTPADVEGMHSAFAPGGDNKPRRFIERHASWVNPRGGNWMDRS